MPEKRNIIRVALIFVLLATSLACPRVNKHVNKNIGYEIVGPWNWHVYSSLNGGVEFSKYNWKAYGNSTINIFIDSLHSWTPTPLEYLKDIYLPGVKILFKETDDFSIRPIAEPFALEKDGRIWATVKYWSGRDSLQDVYITFSRKNVFIVCLNSVGSGHIEDVKLFLRALGTLKIY